jgi:hypothetical protein
MRLMAAAALSVTVAAFAGMAPSPARAESAPAISGPFAHANLAVYFIHGQSAPGPVPLTLQEAMAKGAVRVVETGSVNELKIENTGEEDVYIQSGDIVKGGRQDRALTVSLILPSKSGEVPVAAFCVEHGRWSQRGSENAAQFASSVNSIPSREAKLAMKAPLAAAPGRTASERFSHDETGERQRAVWNEVSKTQQKLSAGVNADVAAPVSSSSLQLSLENAKLKEVREGYVKALEDKAQGGDIVGFVFAVNGKLNSADVYPSNGMFRKMWGKLLNASVTEALGETAKTAGAGAAPSIGAVREFLAAAEKGKSKAGNIGGLAKQDTRDAESALYVEAAKTSGEWVHKNYLAK